MSSFLLHYIFSILLLAPPTKSQSVETLLHSALSSAQCQAKCLSNPFLLMPEDQEDCLTICSIVQTNPSTSLCRYPTLCTGGCKAACQHPPKTDTSLVSLVQQDCHLVWQLADQEDNQNVVFVVAGRDQGGMWNLMFNKLTERAVVLSEEMTAKFIDVTVLAVDSQGVVDKASVTIEHVKCQDSQAQIDDHKEIEIIAEERKLEIYSSVVSFTGNTLQVFSFVSLMVILMILLSIIIIMRRSDKQFSKDDSIGHITKDAFLITKEDFKFDNINCKQQIYNFF